MENKQTAVEWLIAQVNSEQYQIAFGQTYISIDLIEQAKQMERERRKKDFKIAYNQGYLDAQCNHINDAENLANEMDYLNDEPEING